MRFENNVICNSNFLSCLHYVFNTLIAAMDSFIVVDIFCILQCKTNVHNLRTVSTSTLLHCLEHILNCEEFNDFKEISCKSLHVWQIFHITEIKVRLFCLENMLKKTKENNIKIGITVTEWHNRERWQYTNYTDTIPSIKKKNCYGFYSCF